MQPLFSVENLVKRYPKRSFAGAGEAVPALNGISFSVLPRTTMAFVGESGSGKTTLALCLSCLETPTSGTILFEGKNISELAEQEKRRLRPKIQLIYQDPANSLNPRWSARALLLEPLLLQNSTRREEMNRRVHSLLQQVGLSTEILERLPRELSGGQRQRLAIARALALEPKLLILDEALSALDCSVQAQIANLLMELQTSLGTTFLFITHDLAMAAHLADEIAVLKSGKIVEQGPARTVLQQPRNETTRQLLAATPRPMRTASSALEK